MDTQYSFSMLIQVLGKAYAGDFSSERFFFNIFSGQCKRMQEQHKKPPSLDSTAICRYNTGERRIPKKFVQFCLAAEDDTINKITADIKAFVNCDLFDKEKTVRQITSAIQADPAISKKDKEFLNLFSKDGEKYVLEDEQYPKFLAHAILLALRLNRKKEDVSNDHLSAQSLHQDLWLASERAFSQLCPVSTESAEKDRFRQRGIIQELLPQGYVAGNCFLAQGTTDNGTIVPLLELCMESIDDIAVVGDGGMGKTTFLKQVLTNTFTKANGSKERYNRKCVVPFFIELNRCPEHIADWFDSSLHKTNFITRFIGQMKENHSYLNSVSTETLVEVEKEFQKIPPDGKPQYLLLLDGFNEVCAAQTVRACLSNEISVLHQYPNVRIITTSRKTQFANYSAAFINVRLVGLKQKDIIGYLKKSGVSNLIIDNVKTCNSLMRCLRTPLYLCMFTAGDMGKNFLPETAGEILHCFFHGGPATYSAFYNVRRRAAEARTNSLTAGQTAFVLDFILPYVGWVFEEKNTFSVSLDEFEKIIQDSVAHIHSMFLQTTSNSFFDFHYQKSALETVFQSLYLQNGSLNVSAVISCIYDYLGIMYQYQINEGSYPNRIRYSFCHHHFRDYFSAVWDIQMMSMLPCITSDTFYSISGIGLADSTYHHFLNTNYWREQKISFISQILMEHRNRPMLNENTGNWNIPKPKFDEQSVLIHAVDFCRELSKNGDDIHYLLNNILSAIVVGRKEFSGIDLSDLDFKQFSFFNISCSKAGRTQVLSAKFDRSILTKDNFIPESHRDIVVEYLYHGNQCLTIDFNGLIKCWDVRSGKLEYELHSHEPWPIWDAKNYPTKGVLKLSNDGRWLSARVQNSLFNDKGTSIYVNLFDLKHLELPPKRYRPHGIHNKFSYIGFTDDSKSLLMLCDRTVYCFDIATGGLHYSQKFNLRLRFYNELYAESAQSCIFAYTAEYDRFGVHQRLISTGKIRVDPSDYMYSGEKDAKILIPCKICRLDPTSGTCQILYRFGGNPDIVPAVTYIPYEPRFLLYNEMNHRLEEFSCVSKTVTPVLEELTSLIDASPVSIHLHPENHGECYVMYPDVCFYTTMRGTDGNSVLMKYPISEAKRLLPSFSQGSKLEFKSDVVPTKNHFLVKDGTNIYEWDIDNEVLNQKHNYTPSDCIALYGNTEKEFCVLVHECDGVSVFSGTPLQIKQQICFQEAGYSIVNCCYHEKNNILAMTFSRPNYAKVMLLKLETGYQEYIFSTVRKRENIQTLCFSEDGSNLLITTTYQCLEYDTINNIFSVIVQAGTNEKLAAGNYKGNDIELVVVGNPSTDDSFVRPRCDFYVRESNQCDSSYVRQRYYLLPQLQMDQVPFFIHQDRKSIANDFDAEDSYRVMRGFFLEELKLFQNILQPECYVQQEGVFKKSREHFHALDMVYVWYYPFLFEQHGVGRRVLNYIYLSNDIREAVLTEGGDEFSYQTELHSLSYKSLDQAFKRGSGSIEWHFAVPWLYGTLLVCYNSYQLAKVVPKTDKFLWQGYYPGVSICGCSFKNARIDDVVKHIVEQNGGLL